MSDRLSNAVLGELPADVALPVYDRANTGAGIVHLGVGAFHRAHQAAFTDECLTAGETGWGIIAASLRSPDTRDALEPQDNLYTLAVRDSDGESLRIVGSVLETIVAPETPERLLQAMTDPDIRIVTLTITEKGYTANMADRSLLHDHPDIVHDLQTPHTPKSAIGFLTEAIRRRRDAGIAPFTVLSCDNLPSNGETVSRVLREFAALRSPELATYIDKNVACPSSMVDRIVPATTDEDRERIAVRLGVADAWPVIAEPFFQWVIEDRFPTGRPQWENAGAEFVKDVAPYEHMKLRMLNGSHTVIAAIGQIAGLDTVSQTFAHPVVRRFVQLYWSQVATTLADGIDGAAYALRLAQRFDNAALKHRTEQIASDASQKIPQRIIAPFKELHAGENRCDPLVFAIAAWIRSCDATNETGQALAVRDPAYRAWAQQRTLDFADLPNIVSQFLQFDAVFDPALRSNEQFVGALNHAYADIHGLGIIEAIEKNFRP